MLVCIRNLRAFLAALVMLICGATAHAADTTVILRPDVGREQLDAVLDTLQRQDGPVTLRWEGPKETPPPAATPAAQVARATAATSSQALARVFENGLAVRITGLMRLGELPADVARRWAENRNGTTGTVLLRIAAIVGGALLAGWFVHLALRRIGRAGATRIGSALRRLVRGGLGIATFGGTGWLLQRLLLPAPDLAASMSLELLRDLGIVGVYVLAGRVLLAPDHPGLRLLPMPHAAWHHRMLVTYGAIGALVNVTVALFRESGSDTLPLEGWFLLGGTVITLQKLWWFGHGRHDITALFRDHGEPPIGLVRRMTAAALPWIFILVALLIWATGSFAVTGPDGMHWGAAAGATQVIVIALPTIALGADALVRMIGEARHGDGPPTPVQAAGMAAFRTLLRGGIWTTGLYAIARLWNLFLLDPTSVFFLGAAAQVGVAIAVGLAIWSFLETYFQAHLPRHRAAPGEEELEQEPQLPSDARLATMLPIVRDLAFGAVVAATALISLSAMGMDIGPLLAGFGVLGLAISFGSQALVRDIVSGIFFMADDAFRIGEYVDTGRLRGTVERITLRSLQLRHQNGPIHTIPFGTLASVTNYSRDWTTVKFLIRLDHTADLEVARKAIKKVGQQMQEDPAYEGEFILPLKMQGIQEISDAALVIRCKFTAKPNKPTWLQREALKRIHRALHEAGIPFATTAVTVRSGTKDEAAAASQATAALPQPNPG